MEMSLRRQSQALHSGAWRRTKRFVELKLDGKGGGKVSGCKGKRKDTR